MTLKQQNLILLLGVLLFSLRAHTQCPVIPTDTTNISNQNLFIYLPFDLNYQDQSGNGNHPTPTGMSLTQGICADRQQTLPT